MIDRTRLSSLHADEERRFVETHPASPEMSEQAAGSLLAGVPMPWMTRWAGALPVFLRSASGARLVDVGASIRRPPPGRRCRRRCERRTSRFTLNRGVLLTPFHNMALFSPHHTADDVDRHTSVFAEAIAALVG